MPPKIKKPTKKTIMHPKIKARIHTKANSHLEANIRTALSATGLTFKQLRNRVTRNPERKTRKEILILMYDELVRMLNPDKKNP